jgi:hypothetical protein
MNPNPNSWSDNHDDSNHRCRSVWTHLDADWPTEATGDDDDKETER